MKPLPKSAKVFVAGHRGLVGSAILRALNKAGHTNLVVKSRQDLDLLDAGAVNRFFEDEQPEYVFLAAAKVGGILANNNFRADFIYENLTIETNVISSAHFYGVKKLLFLGSSCIYPKLAPQPISENAFLTGELEETNKPYAVAKIAGIVMCQSFYDQYGDVFISAMPTNLYGPYDNFDLTSSHVLPALIRKIHEAKLANLPSVTIWGTGTPRREFLHVDDLAKACLFLMSHYDDPSIINVGTGEDCTIRELAENIIQVIGYKGSLVFDSSKPDGTPRKLLNTEKINALKWKPRISLHQGLETTYRWFLENKVS